MTAPGIPLVLLPDRLAVCRLDADAPAPTWAQGAGFVSVTRTDDELSVVAAESSVPDGVRAERGWRALKVRGPLDFGMVGVLAGLAAPLAAAGVSIFVISTFDTDYLLLKEDQLRRGIEVLGAAGFPVD